MIFEKTVRIPAARVAVLIGRRVLLDWMAELGGGPARMSAARRAA